MIHILNVFLLPYLSGMQAHAQYYKSSVASLSQLHFSKLSHKRCYLKIIYIEHIVPALILSTNLIKNL